MERNTNFTDLDTMGDMAIFYRIVINFLCVLRVSISRISSVLKEH